MHGAERRTAAAWMNVTAADRGVLLLIVLALFELDLLLATRRSHAVGFREAAGWSVFFVTMAAGSVLPSSAWRGSTAAGCMSPRLRFPPAFHELLQPGPVPVLPSGADGAYHRGQDAYGAPQPHIPGPAHPRAAVGLVEGEGSVDVKVGRPG